VPAMVMAMMIEEMEMKVKTLVLMFSCLRFFGCFVEKGNEFFGLDLVYKQLGHAVTFSIML